MLKLKIIQSNQKGAASVFITISVVFILMLVALTYTYFTGVSYAEVVDTQQNLQATYAAQTGINDTRHYIRELIEEHNNIRYGHPISRSVYQSTGRLQPEVTLHRFDLSETFTKYKGRLQVDVDRSNNTILVGEPKNNRATLLAKSTSSWISQKRFLAPTVAGSQVEQFGKAVSQESGLVAIVGYDKTADLDKVYFYEKVSGNWQSAVPASLDLKLSPDWSSSAAASVPKINSIDLVEISTGKYALFVGTRNEQSTAANAYFHFFYKGQTNWTSQDRIFRSGGVRQTSYTPRVAGKKGLSVAYSDELLAVGAPGNSSGAGQALLYNIKETTAGSGVFRSTAVAASTIFDLTTVKTEDFGESVALRLKNGKYSLMVGDGGYDYVLGTKTTTDRGLVYTYSFSATDLTNASYQLPANPGHSLGRMKIANKARFGSDLDAGPGVIAVTAINRVFIFESLSHLYGSGGHLYNIECLNQNQVGASYQFAFNLNKDGTVGYSCLDIDFVPDNIYYDEISDSRSLNNILQTVIYDPSQQTYLQENMDELRIQWKDSNFANLASFVFTSTNSAVAYPNLPPFSGASKWDLSAPVLKLQLTAFDGTGFERHTLAENTKTLYLYPTEDNTTSSITNRSNKTVDYATAKTGDIVKAACNTTTGACDISLMNLPSYVDFPDTDPNDPMQFAINIVSLYQPASVEIQGFSDYGA